MRILIAHSRYRVPGGEDRYVEQQVSLLQERHKVSLAVTASASADRQAATAAGMAYSRARLKDARAAIANSNAQVVHVHNIYPGWGPAVHLAAARESVPLVMTVHNYRLRCPNGLTFTQGEPCTRCVGGAYYNAVVHRCFPTVAQSAVYAASLWMHRFILRFEDRTSLFIAPSLFMRDRLVSWGLPSSKVRVIRNFTDSPLHDEGRGKGGLFAGRLSMEKGVDLLLRALVRAGDPPFTIVGDGPEGAALRSMARDLGLKNVSFTGLVTPETARGFVSRCRFLVVPSLSDENAPLVALEAMAASRPLLVSDRGGLPELARDGGGLVFRSGDVDALAAQIARLAQDDALCEAAGAAARERIRAEMTPEAHREALEDVYRSVVARAVVA
ncbi:MAG TPA: glycosyltransferase family 4 protein [Actinomycetota bacterium]|jgi:glycosyltransferase involved in cell wall biosynthesis|nr:glycosyltransferase family 4 protein [Actinomycetota bacterium]